MTYFILILLALVVVELAALISVVIWRIFAGKQPSEGAGSLLPAPPTSEGEKTSRPEESENEEARRRSENYERLWREGMDSMMSYDLAAARRAVRNDAGEGLD